MEGYGIVVLYADNGTDGIALLREHTEVRIVLMDAMMPEVDGNETTRRMRRLACGVAGAVDYIVKPFDPWMLRSKVGVFADLWTMRAELSSQARECRSLQVAIGDAVQSLERCGPGAEPALGRLRAALAGVPEATSSVPDLSQPYPEADVDR